MRVGEDGVIVDDDDGSIDIPGPDALIAPVTEVEVVGAGDIPTDQESETHFLNRLCPFWLSTVSPFN